MRITAHHHTSETLAGAPAVERGVVERRERRRVFSDPDLKAVESFVHVDVLGVLVDGLYARIFTPRSVVSRLHSRHKRPHSIIPKFDVLFYHHLTLLVQYVWTVTSEMARYLVLWFT